MRVVNVLAVGPDGEGEELGTVETLREAWRIGEPAGWYRIYSSKTICASEHIREVMSLADAPERCARCERILQPGTDASRAHNSEGEEVGVVCQDCGGRRPDLSSLPS